MRPLEVVLGTEIPGGEPVVLRGRDATAHKLVVGVTGAGKSRFLASIAVQLLNQGVGFLLLDPAGDLCDDILSVLLETGYYVSGGKQAFHKLLYLDFTREDAYVPLNILNQPYPPYQIAASVLEAVKRSWASLAGGSAPVLEGLVLYGSLVLTLNHEPLTKLPSLLTNPGYRAALLQHVQDETTLEFFERFAATGGRSNMLSESTLRRISLLAFHPSLRYALGQQTNVLRMRELMDSNRSILINLGGLDSEVQSFLGCLISTAVEEGALSRADMPEQARLPFYCLIDEYLQFSSRSAVGLERVLSLTRKYGLSLWIGNQVFAQIPTELRATLGQATFIGFRLSRQDASFGAELVTTVDRERIKYTASGTPTYMSATEQRAEWEDLLTTLPPRQAVLRLGEQTTRFQTLVIPGAGKSRHALEAVKEQYAQLYLTPRMELETRERRTTVTEIHKSSQPQQGIPRGNTPRLGGQRARRFTKLDTRDE